MTPQDVIYGLIIGLAVGTAIGIVLADFWNSIRWRNVTRETLDTAREQRRKRLQAEERCELYRQLWLEAVGANSPAGYDDPRDKIGTERYDDPRDKIGTERYSRKVPNLSVVEKAGV